jgi:hypothetical protein
MDKLQWFKFSYADWRMGKIQKCPEITQARFLNLCCLYWSKESNLSIEDAEIEIDKEHLDILISKKIVEVDAEHVFIKFLDEQLGEIAETSKGKSKAAKARWDKYKKDKASEEKNDANAMHMHKDAMQNNAEKRRGEEKREDKIKEVNAKAFKSESDFLEFFNKGVEKLFKRKGLFRTLTKTDLNNLKRLNTVYTAVEFKQAMVMMSKNDWVKSTNNYTPTHLLRDGNFTKYLNQTDVRPMAQGLIEGN